MPITRQKTRGIGDFERIQYRLSCRSPIPMRGAARRDPLQDTSPARREYSLRTISDRAPLRRCVLPLYLAVARCLRGRPFRQRRSIWACQVDSKIRGGQFSPKPSSALAISWAVPKPGGQSGPDVAHSPGCRLRAGWLAEVQHSRR